MSTQITIDKLEVLFEESTPNRFRHAMHGPEMRRAQLTGETITALCGYTSWLAPSTGVKPMCPKCAQERDRIVGKK